MNVRLLIVRLIRLTALSVLAVLFAACREQSENIVATATSSLTPGPALQTTEQPPRELETPPSDAAYPPPPPAASTDGPYPPPSPTYATVDPYPASGELPGILLALERPLHDADTAIRGVGPAGIVVYARNITQMGINLGQATVAEDGTFSIVVPPLEAGNRIGITTEAVDIVPDGIRPGDGALNVPQVGYFYDTVLVTP